LGSGPSPPAAGPGDVRNARRRQCRSLTASGEVLGPRGPGGLTAERPCTSQARTLRSAVEVDLERPVVMAGRRRVARRRSLRDHRQLPAPTRTQLIVDKRSRGSPHRLPCLRRPPSPGGSPGGRARTYPRRMGPQGIYIIGAGQLAAYLGVSLSAVLRWVRASELPPAYQLDSAPVWRTEDIDRWWSL
jgi:predicted DNA-binding transcriptional regulator AlpA